MYLVHTVCSKGITGNAFRGFRSSTFLVPHYTVAATSYRGWTYHFLFFV